MNNIGELLLPLLLVSANQYTYINYKLERARYIQE